MPCRVCDMDCLNCKFDDCVNDKVYYDSSCYKNRSEKAKAHAREYQKKLRETAKANGLCVVCRKKTANHGVQCDECFAKAVRYQKKRREEKARKKEYSNECHFCNRERLPGKKVCEIHYEMCLKNLEKAYVSEGLMRHNQQIKEAESKRISAWRARHEKQL